MAVWILLVIGAQFLNAIVALVDKYILATATIPRPIAYAFYIMLLSAFSALAFAFSWIPIPIEDVALPSFGNVMGPTLTVIWISVLAGFLLFGALIALFTAFKRADASDVIPVSGACSAIGAFVLSYLLLDTSLSDNFLWGFVLLVVGMFVLSLYRFTPKTFIIAVLSGFLFAAHFVCIKFLFSETNFDNAFFWTRVGIVAVAVFVFLLPWVRRRLKVSKSARAKASTLVISNKLLAGLAGLMLLKAIELGDVSIVQALGGLQFAFLLGLTAMFRKSVIKACGENCGHSDIVQKAIAVSIIALGVFVLFL